MAPTPERWQKIEDLYHAALERGQDVLADADPELRREVESLLAAAPTGKGLLDKAAFGLPSQFGTTPLKSGTRLGPYQIEGLIGQGGMGQVYRARDTRLGRSVAIKTSRARFSDRFEREARAIAALNHPHICHLYDAGPDYLVMEYIEGTPLKGPFPFGEALKYAVQICDALDTAHRAGIVHRDLKPGNILLSKKGIKLLDFGLAQFETGPDDPTITQLTGEGAVMGTPAYMAPEQHEGKRADNRSDIYAVGCVLYEMLTGKRAGAERTTFAQPFEGVLRTCLERDPEERWQSARDLKHALIWAEQSVAAARPTRSRAWISWTIAVIAAGWLGGVLLWPPRRAPGLESVRFAFQPPDNTWLVRSHRDTALSPDGRHIALLLRDASGATAIWVRALDSQELRRIDGTDDAGSLFWSPDGRFLGFFAQGKLKKIALAGGPAQNICTTPPGLGATWSPAGEVVFNPTNRAPLMRVSAAGGTPQPLTVLDPARQENSHRYPSFLPDGRHFLFTARSSQKENTAIYAGSLDSKEIKRILTEQSNAVYVPPGYILFARDGSLMAQRFDAPRLELSGEAFPVVGNVDQETPSANAFFTASADGGAIAWSEVSHSADQLTWFDHSGTKLGTLGPAGHYSTPRLSPDGKRLAVTIPDPESGNRDIWILALESGSLTRFTTNPANDWIPVWSPDGKYLAFASDRTPRSTIYRKAADGSGEEELLVPAGDTMGAFTEDWSRDGRLLGYHANMSGSIGFWLLPLTGGGKPRPFLPTMFREFGLKFSPDGNTVAYSSNESGTFEVYAAPIDKPGKQRVSFGGGAEPNWRPDGKELYFVSHGSLMGAEVKRAGESVSFGAPRAAFSCCQYRGSGSGSADYDISPDGKRFLFPCMSVDVRKQSVAVMIGWLDMVKRTGRY
jgi:Tol biopolymer transport system component/predicted Ser/Thr protein kinase